MTTDMLHVGAYDAAVTMIAPRLYSVMESQNSFGDQTQTIDFTTIALTAEQYPSLAGIWDNEFDAVYDDM